MFSAHKNGRNGEMKPHRLFAQIILTEKLRRRKKITEYTQVTHTIKSNFHYEREKRPTEYIYRKSASVQKYIEARSYSMNVSRHTWEQFVVKAVLQSKFPSNTGFIHIYISIFSRRFNLNAIVQDSSTSVWQNSMLMYIVFVLIYINCQVQTMGMWILFR